MRYSPESVAEHLGVVLGEVKPSFALAPGRSIAVVRLAEGGGKREVAMLHWGFICHGAKSAKMDDHMIFAKAETVMHQAAYQEAFRLRRCLIPADGFYEWQKEHGHREPYFVRMRNSHLFAFGGIWGRWEGADGKVVESCAILTTESNPLVKPLHSRMPVIIRPEHYEMWLNAGTAVEQLGALLAAYPAREMTAYPVDERVRKPGPDEPSVVEPVGKQPGEEGALFRPLVEELHRAKAGKRVAKEQAGDE